MKNIIFYSLFLLINCITNNLTFAEEYIKVDNLTFKRVEIINKIKEDFYSLSELYRQKSILEAQVIKISQEISDIDILITEGKELGIKIIEEVSIEATFDERS